MSIQFDRVSKSDPISNTPSLFDTYSTLSLSFSLTLFHSIHSQVFSLPLSRSHLISFLLTFIPLLDSLIPYTTLSLPFSLLNFHATLFSTSGWLPLQFHFSLNPPPSLSSFSRKAKNCAKIERKIM